METVLFLSLFAFSMAGQICQAHHQDSPEEFKEIPGKKKGLVYRGANENQIELVQATLTKISL